MFTRKELCDIIIKNLSYCQQNKDLKIFEYVIMPSHLHMIVQNTDCRLPQIIRDFKSYTAKRIIETVTKENFESRKEWLIHMFEYHAKFKNQNARYMVWQKTNFPIELSSPKIFQQKQTYIRENPTASGLVTKPESWYYSSANPGSPLKIDHS